MREYARVSPRFWIGDTGRQIKKLGLEAQVISLYLLTNPHSNMLGLYYLPITYLSHETGIPFEGASKGLQSLIEAGFCSYDFDAEVVFIHEMAFFQLGKSLKPTDNQCKGIKNAYDELPNNIFLNDFFEKYGEAFCMIEGRGLEGACKTLRSKEKEKEKEKEKDSSASCEAPPPKNKSTQKPDGVSDQLWSDLKSVWKAKRKPVTETAIAKIKKVSHETNLSVADVILMIVENTWQGVESEWVRNKLKSAPQTQTGAPEDGQTRIENGEHQIFYKLVGWVPDGRAAA